MQNEVCDVEDMRIEQGSCACISLVIVRSVGDDVKNCKDRVAYRNIELAIGVLPKKRDTAEVKAAEVGVAVDVENVIPVHEIKIRRPAVD